MYTKQFPVIDLEETGKKILYWRKARGLSVKDLQFWFGFEEPQAIYKWQKGKSLPTVDNLFALSVLLDVPVEQILVCKSQSPDSVNGQQGKPCCPSVFFGCFGYGRSKKAFQPIFAQYSLE